MVKSEYSIEEIKKLWQKEPDEVVLKAATEDKKEYPPDIYAVIKEEALLRGLLQGLSEEDSAGEEVLKTPHILDPRKLKLPQVWIGFLLAVGFLIGELFEMEGDYATFVTSPICATIALAGIIYWYICVYRFHRILVELSNNTYPISPAVAVGYNFIPFYNLYWVFKWPTEFSSFINNQGLVHMIPGFLLGLFVLASYLLLRVDGALGLLCMFTISSYMKHKLKGQIDQQLAEQEGTAVYQKQRWVAGIVILILSVATVAFVGGIYATDAGKAFMENLFSDEEAADITKTNTLSREGFILQYPSNWTVDRSDDSYDPDHYFSIESAGGSVIVFVIVDASTTPEENVESIVAEYVPNLMKNAVRTAFTTWGKYSGAGVHLKGRLFFVPGANIRVFSHSSAFKSFTIIESFYDEDVLQVCPGFELIASTFELR